MTRRLRSERDTVGAEERFGQVVRDFRLTFRMTQAELAEELKHLAEVLHISLTGRLQERQSDPATVILGNTLTEIIKLAVAARTKVGLR